MFQFIPALFGTIGAKAAAIGITKAAVAQAGLGMVASAIMNKSADNRPQTTKTTSKSRTNFQEMRDDAIAAGYNPLTALRMTGGAGNVTTTGTSVISTPALSSRAILGRAVGAGLNSLGNSISSYDPLVQKQKELNIRLAEQQLRNGNRSSVGAPALIPETLNTDVSSDTPVQPVSPKVEVSVNQDGSFVGDTIESTRTTYVDYRTGKTHEMLKGDELDELAVNYGREWYMRLDQPRINIAQIYGDFPRFKNPPKSSAGGPIPKNYKIHRDDILNGVLPAWAN